MYDKLVSPVRIGRVEIKNRVAMPSMGVNLAAAGGGVNDDIMAFYEARARGGVGLILSGVCRVMDGTGASEACQIVARNGGDLQGLEVCQKLSDRETGWSSRSTSSIVLVALTLAVFHLFNITEITFRQFLVVKAGIPRFWGSSLRAG